MTDGEEPGKPEFRYALRHARTEHGLNPPPYRSHVDLAIGQIITQKLRPPLRVTRIVVPAEAWTSGTRGKWGLAEVERAVNVSLPEPVD